MSFLSKRIFICLLSTLFALLSSQSMARCKMDEAPVIPQTPDITFEELKAIKQSVDAYMDNANHYIGCQRREKKIEDAIQEMKLVAAEYNVLIMLFKSTLTEEQEMQLSGR